MIRNDILSSVDDGRVTVLILLDIFTAFKPIDHTILMRTLYDLFRVTGKALE